MRLKDQAAIVTGSGGSIGRATALRLAKEGAAVAVWDIDEDRATLVADEINSGGGTAVAMKVDVRSTQEIEQMTKSVIERFGRIDMLVNVAGGSARRQNALLYQADEEVIDRIMNINLRGALYCCRAVLGPMVDQGSGKIINVTSIVGSNGKAKLADYTAAKAGVIGLTKTLAIEAGPYGINVNCVSPGLVPREGENDNLEHIRRTNVLGKVGKPEDISNMIMFLMSDEAEFITGQNFIVDGGRSLGLRGDW
jgi:3-oxoacyl-[acyl-carrier protein] reductase